MKCQYGHNDQHTSGSAYIRSRAEKSTKIQQVKGEKNRVCNFFFKKLQIFLKIRNKCPIGINVHWE